MSTLWIMALLCALATGSMWAAITARLRVGEVERELSDKIDARVESSAKVSSRLRRLMEHLGVQEVPPDCAPRIEHRDGEVQHDRAT